MKQFIFLVTLVFCVKSVSAQTQSDPAALFKMMVFLDNDNSRFPQMDTTVIKGDSLYSAFSEVYVFALDSLSAPNFGDYKFYKLNMDETITTRKLKRYEAQYIGIISNPSSYYVLAVNSITGLSYRLKGFRANDFFTFLYDFKESLKNQTHEKLSDTKFLKQYKVEGLDFECLYKGLKAKEFDSDKYHCLRKVSDPIPAHAIKWDD